VARNSVSLDEFIRRRVGPKVVLRFGPRVVERARSDCVGNEQKHVTPGRLDCRKSAEIVSRGHRILRVSQPVCCTRGGGAPRAQINIRAKHGAASLLVDSRPFSLPLIAPGAHAHNSGKHIFAPPNGSAHMQIIRSLDARRLGLGKKVE